MWRKDSDHLGGATNQYYHLGAIAHKQGIFVHGNPYETNGAREAWARGWLDSYEAVKAEEIIRVIDLETNTLNGFGDFLKGFKHDSSIHHVVNKLLRRNAPMNREKVYGVGVIFPDKSEGYTSPSLKRYHYKTDIPDIQLGDDCIVNVSGKHVLVKVVEIWAKPVDLPNGRATKWIVQKVDHKAYEARILKEERVKVLKKRIDENLVAFQRKKSYKDLFEQDNEAKAMWDELVSLDPEAISIT